MKAKSEPLTLRAVTPKDVVALAQLWFEGWQLGHAAYAPKELTALRTLDSFQARIRDSQSDCFISGPIGSPNAFVRILEDEIDQFYVDPKGVRQGLGKRLMAASELHFLAQGITRPHLFCAEKNDRAAGFYTAMGWKHCEVSNEPFETSAGPFVVPVIRFEKTLAI